MDSRVARLVPSDARTRLAVALLALAALLATIGIALSTGPSPAPEAAPPTASPSPTPEARTPGPTPILAEAPSRPAGPPTALRVPSLDLSAPVVPIEMDADGVLTPPADVNTVGWWQRSAQPGSRDGQTLVTGHSVRLGDGAMDDIGLLEPGARVELEYGDTTTTYRTTRVFTYSRDQVAENAVALFGQQRTDGRLVLVTCTDWNGEFYESNIIVLADRASSS